MNGTISNPANGPTQAGSTDRNGNKITTDSNGHFYDTMSGSTAALTVSGSGSPSSPRVMTYPAPGGSASYQMKYTAYTVQTKFNCSGISEYGPTGNNLVSEIDLPDGSKYTFTYEVTPNDAHNPHYVTGRIASATLPTGGTINYSYSGGSNGITCSDGSAAGLSRATPDGTWSYARSGSTTTVTDPQGNQTVIQFSGIYELQRQVYQGSTSGTLLQTVNTCYNGAAPPCTSASLPITQRNIYRQFGSSGSKAQQALFYNGYGLLTEEDDYDYPSGATLLRKTITNYASLGNGIVSMPSSVTICNGTGTSSSCAGPSGGSVGTVVSQTAYQYDQGTASASSGTPQHVSISGSRGNATTISTLVAGSTTLNRTFTYYDTGMINAATDVNGAATTYNYSNATATCGNTFPTSLSEPLSLSRSFTWNCTGAVLTQLTDENGKNTTTSYTDAYFWRPASVTDATNAVTNSTYATSSPYNWTESYMNFGSSTVDVRSTVDGLGRPILQQKKQAPGSGNYDTVETDYDSLGRVAKVSLPFSASAGGTNSSAPGTSTQYDALNRPTSVTDSGGLSTSYTYTQNDTYVSIGPAPSGENAKRQQLEYDGLGRLTSVCEITSASDSGTCAQQTTQTGYWSKYAYSALGNILSVTQNAQASSGYQQNRSYTFDGLGRLTSESNPETGTTSYTFDTDSTCGTSNGDLVKKVDAIGNVICTAYDAFHRPVTSTYPSGNYASVTPAKHFVYDSATVNGATMSNAKARLAEAYTCTGSCSTKITDDGFSYTARGDLSDIYESTPNSAGYYHVTATYFANGAVNQLSGLPSLPTITNGVEGEGRISTVSAASGQNPVTSTSYNVFGQPYQVSFGSQDSDGFSFDSNTARMTQYQFNINGQADSGTLTWNANSTLQKLVISDAFNSTDSQTCNYGYDDLVRLATANCGSGWSQTFGYDAFSNITKSGSISFQPVYTNPQTGQNTNRFISIPGTSVSYDANGNVLSDGSHTYTWDADGHSITLDGVNLVYDALGRMVEQNRSGSYTQIVYSPAGAKLALMGGQTLQKAFFPLPGKATAVYTSNGLDHYRHSDWLGSSRLTSTPSRTVSSTVAYAPFGETYAQSGTADTSFTGQNQDTTSGDFDFLYREYTSSQGRWPSPDPAGQAAVDPSNPQSWNRYAYVLNNPLGYTDPLGMDTCSFGDGNEFPCWYNASYNSLVDGVPPTAPKLGGAQFGRPDPETGNQDYLFTACTPSNSGKNQATNCGYQGGEEMADNYNGYEKMVGQDPCALTASFGGKPFYADCSNLSPALANYIKLAPPPSPFYYGDWQWFLGDMGMSDFFAFPSVQQLTAQYLQSLSWGAMMQSTVQQSCKAASQAIATFENKHPGAPVPPSLLQASANCAQAAMPVH